MGLPRSAVQILMALGEGERHGYGIMRTVEDATGGTVRLGPGTLYTTLARLEGDGLIEESDARPDPSIDDQRRRYWRLTPTGRAVAVAEVRRLAAVVDRARPWAFDEEG
jgi:DNA-binding PadR family transcriptional regulator